MKSEYIVLLGVAALATFIIWLPKQQQNKEKGQKNSKEKGDVFKNGPVAFGYKCTWFAVSTDNIEAVAEAINLVNAVRVPWSLGIDEAYHNSVFITPVVDGWTLVVGQSLPHDGSVEKFHETINMTNMLSERFGEVHFFSTHRVVEYHCWVKSVKGQTERIYSYLGEKGENIMVSGKPTPAELKYNLVNTLSDKAKNDDYWEEENLVFPDEELVMEIAGEWSINPTTLEDRKHLNGFGLLGNIKRIK